MRKRRLKQSDAWWLAGVILLVLLQFWWLPGDPGTPDDSYSVSVEGKRGFFQTLKSLSTENLLPPVQRESHRLIPKQSGTLVILSPDRYPNDSEQRQLAEFVRGGGTLLFAPNWMNPDCAMPQLNISTTTSYLQDEDLGTTALAPATPATAVPPTAPMQTSTPVDLKKSLPAEAPEVTVAQQPDAADTPKAEADTNVKTDSNEQQIPKEEAVAKTVGTGTTLQPSPVTPVNTLNSDYDFNGVAHVNTVSPLVKGGVPWRTRARVETLHSNATVLVQSLAGTPQAASWQYGAGRVVVCASADVFSNRAMLDEVRAELAIRLVVHAHEPHLHSDFSPSPSAAPIIVNEFLNASDAYRGTAVLINPSLRSGTLQLITVAVLIGWFGFHRFGPATKVTIHHRRSLTESASAVGNLHFRTNSGSEVVERYVDYFKARLQRTFGHSIAIEDTAAIAMRANMEPSEVERRITLAMSRCHQATTTNTEAATCIRDLSQILNQLSGKHTNTPSPR